MEESEIEQWIGRIGRSEYAIEKLETFGEPALRRLFDALDGAVLIPDDGGDPREVLTDRSRALGRLGARYPDVLLALVQGRKSLKFGVITALGYSGDDGLKAVAKEALSQRGSRES